MKGRKGTKVKNKKVIVLSVLGVFVAFLAAGVFGVVTLCNSWLEDLPDYQNADVYNTAQPTMVYASDGTTLLAEFQLENRDPVALDQISEYVLKGTVATEDERFYTHSGVDYLGVARALVNNLMGGELEGASTITQQFVRNTILSDEMRDISFKRKIREMYISQKLEELEKLKGDRVREVLSRYNARYMIDGKEVSPAQLLEQLGFTNAHLNMPVETLSGGQKRRLQLMLILLDSPNVLILDEPGNDLDTDMLAIVEDLLDGWPGTLILVTHDRFLMERVTDQQWALLDGHLTHMPGGVDQYLRLCNATAEGEPVGAPSAKTGTFDTGAAAAAAEKPKSSGQPNGLSNAERQKLRREVSSLERKMETQRARVEEAEAAMAQVDPTNYTALGEQQAKIDEAHAAMDELEMAWLEASEKLEGEE